jgi:hypothetical protein
VIAMMAKYEWCRGIGYGGLKFVAEIIDSEKAAPESAWPEGRAAADRIREAARGERSPARRFRRWKRRQASEARSRGRACFATRHMRY